MKRNPRHVDYFIDGSMKLNHEYKSLIVKSQRCSPKTRTRLFKAIDDTKEYVNDTYYQLVRDVDARLYKDIPLTSTLIGLYDDYINDVEFTPNESDKVTLYTPIKKINFDLDKYIIKNNIIGYRCILHNTSFTNFDVDNPKLVGLLGIPSVIFASYGIVIDGVIYQPSKDKDYIYDDVCNRYPEENISSALRYYINDCYLIDKPKATYKERLERLYEVITEFKTKHPFIYNVWFKNLDVTEQDILGYTMTDTTDIDCLSNIISDTDIEGKHIKGVNITHSKQQYQDMKPIKVCDYEDSYMGLIKDIVLNVPKDANIRTLNDDVLGYVIMDVTGLTIPLYRQDTLLKDIQTFNEFKELYNEAIIGFKFRDKENKKDPYIVSRMEFE